MLEKQALCAQEVWVPVKDWPYEVSSWGRVRRMKAGGNRAKVGGLIKPVVRSNGYVFVELYRATRLEYYDRRKWNSESKQAAVHRLVAAAFLGVCPKGIQVNHIDGNKTNSKLTNLEYVTPGQNKAHSYRIGTSNAKGEHNGRAKLTDVEVIKIRQLADILINSGSSVLKACKILSMQFGRSMYTIKHVVQRTRWAHVQ
jgi:hypothetical protein